MFTFHKSCIHYATIHMYPANTKPCPNAALMLAHRLRHFLYIRTTLSQRFFLLGTQYFYPANQRRSNNVGLMLDQRRRRWTNTDPTLVERTGNHETLTHHWCMLGARPDADWSLPLTRMHWRTWLKLPAWKVGDRGLEPHSGLQVAKKQIVSPRPLVMIFYCGNPPWSRGSLLGPV